MLGYCCGVRVSGMMQEYLKTAVIFVDRRFYSSEAYMRRLSWLSRWLQPYLWGKELAFIDHLFLAYAVAMQSEALTSVMSAITALGSGVVVAG